MFSFLKDLDYRLFERYRTLERNIKSASNSFYDSYLDLQEQFLRIVLENECVETSSGNSAGSLLKNPAFLFSDPAAIRKNGKLFHGIHFPDPQETGKE